ncbi:response regulator [Legionella fairfieldensis]|uniref:response regulator n=1 Tax=Legionella fairfieldensis TaxID=45064 RepID=UPI0010414FB7|nr:response regulator [Legionella fairfieldensis]
MSDDYLVSIYSDPYKALEEIISTYKENMISNSSDFLIELEDEDNDKNYFSVDFSKIKAIDKSPVKNSIISVAIVDYSIPLMNGIEFCEKIAHLPILKIMLTGHADFKIAVDAFNKGIIDRFLVKDTPNMLDEIVESIKFMQNQFFEKQSYPLLNCLSATKETLITSSEYGDHLKSIINQLNAKEYYMLNALGNYLLITQSGARYYFIVLLDKQLEEFIDIATDAKANQELISKMINRTHAPIFIEDDDYKLPVSEWNFILRPIQKMKNYYYCIFQRTN